MYELLIELIGINPSDDLIGFTFCFMLVIWFTYQLFGFLFNVLVGKR